MIDAIVSSAYKGYHVSSAIWDWTEAVVMMRIPMVKEIALVCNAVNGGMNAYSALKTQPTKLYWAHSLTLSVVGTFGGGIIAPILLGKPSAILNNDLILIACTAVWYVLNYLKGEYFLNLPPVKAFWLCMLGIFRTSVVINIVQTANATLTATRFYPIPVVGPILSGTVLGCMGSFIPFDKGLAAITKGTPWAFQAATLSAAFYHLMINDQKGCLGIGLRALVGTYTPATTAMIIAIMQVLHLELQYFIHPDVNLFAPIHKLLYLIFPVDGPKPAPKPPMRTIDKETPLPYAGWDYFTRQRLRVLMEVVRVSVVILGLLMHIYLTVLPVQLPTPPAHLTQTWTRSVQVDRVSAQHRAWTVSMSHNDYRMLTRTALPLHQSIGQCQWLAPWRACTPWLMKFQQLDNENSMSAYRLAVYRHVVNRIVWDGALDGRTPTYTSPTLHTPATPATAGEPLVVVSAQGVVYAVWGPDWSGARAVQYSPVAAANITVVPWFSLSSATSGSEDQVMLPLQYEYTGQSQSLDGSGSEWLEIGSGTAGEKEEVHAVQFDALTGRVVVATAPHVTSNSNNMHTGTANLAANIVSAKKPEL